MSSCAVRSFTDPGAFAAAVFGANVDLAVVGGGNFATTLTRIELPSMGLQQFHETLPQIAHSASVSGRVGFALHMQPGAAIQRNGIEIASNTLSRSNRPRSIFQRSTGPIRWGTLSMSPEQMQTLDAAAAGSKQASSAGLQIISPAPTAMARLQRIYS